MLMRKWLILSCSTLLVLWLLLFLHCRQSRSDTVLREVEAAIARLIAEKELQTSIPTTSHIIHQSWKTARIPDIFWNLSLSWSSPECLPGWKRHLWTDASNRRLIEKHYTWFLPVYDNGLRNPIERADVARYFYMYHYGGIYTDLDNECIQPFEHLLTPYAVVLGAMEGQYEQTKLSEGYVQNSFMYSRPGEPFWLLLVSRIASLAASAEAADLLPEKSTGPIIVSQLLQNLRLNQPALAARIKVYPPSFFNPFSWLHPDEASAAGCKTNGHMSYTDWRRCRSTLKRRGAFVAQYHFHSWSWSNSPIQAWLARLAHLIVA